MFFIETVSPDLEAELAPRPQRYPRSVRLAVVVGLSTVLWVAIIVGGWGLYSLLA